MSMSQYSPAHAGKPRSVERAIQEPRRLPEPTWVIAANSASPSELAGRWLARRRERARFSYVRRAIFDHYNIAMLTAIAVSSMISGSLWVLLAGLLAELAVIAVVPRIGAFRRRVDDHLAMLEQGELCKEREQLLMQMNEGHRDQFERLEHLVDRIRASGSDAAGALNRELGLDRMLATYVELSIAHRQGHQFLAMTSRRQLERELRALRLRSEEPSTSPRIRRLQEHRLAIAEKRLDRWDRNREHLDVIDQQLATISELIQLVHEHSMTPMGTQSIAEEIEHLLVELDENDGILSELDDACASHDDALGFADAHALHEAASATQGANGNDSWSDDRPWNVRAIPHAAPVDSPAAWSPESHQASSSS
jgi:hypothetical protein